MVKAFASKAVDPGFVSPLKGRQGSDHFTKLLFESGYTFTVPVDANVSVEVVVTRKSNNKKLPVHCTTMSSCFDQFKSWLGLRYRVCP